MKTWMNQQNFYFFFFHNFTCDIYNFTWVTFFCKWPDYFFFSSHKHGMWNHVKFETSHVKSTCSQMFCRNMYWLFSHKMIIPSVKFTFSHVNGIHLYMVYIHLFFSHVHLNFQRWEQSMAHEVRGNVFLHVAFFHMWTKEMLHELDSFITYGMSTCGNITI